MSLVYHHKIPSGTEQAWRYRVLLGEIHGSNALWEALPGIASELIAGEVTANHLEDLIELRAHLVLPLNRERSRGENQHTVKGATQFKFLDEQTRHDRLTSARVVAERETQARLRQHVLIHRLKLMGKRLYTRQRDSKIGIKSIGEANT